MCPQWQISYSILCILADKWNEKWRQRECRWGCDVIVKRGSVPEYGTWALGRWSWHFFWMRAGGSISELTRPLKLHLVMVLSNIEGGRQDGLLTSDKSPILCMANAASECVIHPLAEPWLCSSKDGLLSACQGLETFNELWEKSSNRSGWHLCLAKPNHMNVLSPSWTFTEETACGKQADWYF